MSVASRTKGAQSLFSAVSVARHASFTSCDVSLALVGFTSVPKRTIGEWVTAAMESAELAELLNQPESWLLREEPSEFHFTFECVDSLVITIVVGSLVCPDRDVLSDAAITKLLQGAIDGSFGEWMDKEIEGDREFALLRPVGTTADGGVIFGEL